MLLVDGLEEIPDEDHAIRDELLDLMPFGRSSFRFLYSGRPGALARLPESARHAMQPAQYPLTRFSLEESFRYLDGLGIEEGDARQLLDLTHGIPGHLAIVRSVLAGGLPVDQLMADMPGGLSRLFDYQWDAVTRADPANRDFLLDLLAVLAFDRGHHTVRSLARLSGGTSERVKTLLSSLGFMRVGKRDETAAQGNCVEVIDESEIAIVPEGFRAYTSRQLASRERRVRERVVDYRTEHPLSDDALTELPNSLAALGRRDALLNDLSPDYFVALIERQRTLAVALTMARAFRNLGDGGEVDKPRIIV